ncbi:IclR family transcriptional regulator [Muricoccus radiodurans]|uniref:IclR family transcriptional regulator n=1 Tax=Muricoccus radiodurans TaxID=2231721 RepID=UPI003CE81ED5
MMEARIQSVGRAAALLDGMADGGWHALGALAALTRLPKGTAHNLIGALQDCGLVEHDPARGAYRLGLRFLALGRAVERRLDLVPMLRPLLLRLSAETGETVNLAVPRPTDAMIVESLEGTRHGVRVSSYAGTAAAYHSTACGRALLAHRPEAERQALYALGPLRAETPGTVTDPARLEAILAECRRRGWTEEREENEPGACCVAAPVMGPGGAVAAISVAGPAARMDPRTTARLGRMLRDALRPIESHLAA